jgi:hypothetical protein
MALKVRKGDVVRLCADPAAALVIREGWMYFTGSRGGAKVRVPDGAVDFAAGAFTLALMADGTLLQLGVNRRWEQIGAVPDGEVLDEVAS